MQRIPRSILIICKRVEQDPSRVEKHDVGTIIGSKVDDFVATRGWHARRGDYINNSSPGRGERRSSQPRHPLSDATAKDPSKWFHEFRSLYPGTGAIQISDYLALYDRHFIAILMKLFLCPCSVMHHQPPSRPTVLLHPFIFSALTVFTHVQMYFYPTERVSLTWWIVRANCIFNINLNLSI